MKLKKLLAGITAAALAVSAMAFSSLTASAEEEPDFKIESILFAKGNDGEAWKWIGDVEFDNATHKGNNVCVWENVGTGDENETVSGDIYEEGIMFKISDKKYVNMPVTFEATCTFMDTGSVASGRSFAIPSQTSYFIDEADTDDVFVIFPLGLTEEDIGETLRITYTITFDPDSASEMDKYYAQFKSGEIELVNADDIYTAWFGNLDVEGIDFGETTFDKIKNSIFTLQGIKFENCSLSNIKDSDVKVFIHTIYNSPDEDKEIDVGYWDGNMSSSEISCVFAAMTGDDGKPDDDYILKEIAYEVVIDSDNITDKSTPVIVNEDKTIKTYNIPFSTDELKLTVQPADWGKNEAVKFSKYAEIWQDASAEGITLNETTYESVKNAKFYITGIEYKDCSLGADVKAEDIQVCLFIKFENKDKTQIFFKAFNSMSEKTIGGQLSNTDIFNCENAETGETSPVPDDDAVIIEIGYEVFINGNYYDIDSMDDNTPVIINKAPAEEKPAEETPKDDENEIVPAPTPAVGGNKHQGMGMTPVIINQKSAPAASAGEAAASGSTSVTLGDSTTVSKDVIDSVSGKESVEFKLANGASWEIAGADAAKTEGMDLGIVLDTKTATAAQLKDVAKDNDTFQFSLNYSGDFGFSAVVNIPVDAKYNGKYANLYWFNNGKFEFVGSSKVEGGIADFTMTHASDYVIVFDEEAYGEDVSSGAGVYEEESETSAPAAVVVTFAALAVSAVILKKRVF